MTTPPFFATLDVGTTHVRCFIIDSNCKIRGSALEKVNLLSPLPGYFEIEPEKLWSQIVNVLQGAIAAAELKPRHLTGLALSTQRCTFLAWNHRTQEYYHNFITWKDLRADTLVDEWNSGFALKTVNAISYALYLVTRNKRFLAGSVVKLMNGQVTLRLLHEMRTNTQLQQAVKENKARIEFLDSWILYKLRSGNGVDVNVEHITDVSSCAATGLFDPFTLDWSPLLKMIFGIERKLLPTIVDNAYRNYGSVHPNAIGEDWKHSNVPICSAVSDQTAAMWGSQCFEKGDVKITIGTGAFLNLITGSKCRASLLGMYPLVAWQFKNMNIKKAETVFCMEGAAHDMGTIISWAQSCGIFDDINETASIASSVTDTNGVYFVPAFSGLGPPINDHRAGSGFIGITPLTKRAHLIRAILESIVFRLVQLCVTAERETDYKLKLLKVDGGVSRNDFVCQFLADASGIHVERAHICESSIMGATYIAGINSGIWHDTEDIRKFRHVERIFQPSAENFDSIRRHMVNWFRAVDRFGHWY